MKCYNHASTMELCDSLKEVLSSMREERGFDAKKYIKEKTAKLNRYMTESGLNACVIAVSGGIDSSIVLGLVYEASKQTDSPIKKIVPVLLPCYDNCGVTNQTDATSRGKDVCIKYGLEPVEINMHEIVETIRNSVETKIDLNTDPWAIGQLVPYSRTPVLYYTTSLLNVAGYKAIIVGTTNFSEGGYLGYVGKASDGMVDVQLISDIYKSEVYAVAKELDLPKSVINVTPAGDMYDSRADEDVFGAPYDFVELYQTYLRLSNPNKVTLLQRLPSKAMEQFDEYSKNLEHLHKYNSHKYLCGSPAVHLDLWDSNIPGGWQNKIWN